MPVKTMPGALQPGNFETLAEFTAGGHREIAPVFLNGEGHGLLGVHGAHGLYRMGIHADGRPVVLFAADPHDLDPVQHNDAKFREKYAPGHYIDIDRMKNVEVVAARPARTQKKWVLEAIHRHSFHYNDLRSEYGFLYRLSDRLWASSAAVYALEPLDARHPQFDPQNEKFMLRCYTAAGRAYSVAEIARKIQAGKLHPFLKLGTCHCVVTADEAEDIVRDDFAKRMVLLLRDRDPGLLGRVKGEPELSSRLSPAAEKISDKARQGASHITMRAIQGLERQIRTIKARYVAMGFAKTLVLSTIQFLAKGWRAFIGQMAMGVFQPILDAIKHADRISNPSSDVAYSFWQKGRSARTGNEHYCRLDPAQGRLVRLLGFDESAVRPAQGATVRAALPADWAEDYILDTFGSPPGTIMERRRVGDMDILCAQQPNGLAVYYLMGRRMAYAEWRPDLVAPLADPLPQPVRALIARKGPVVRVESGPGGALTSAAVDPRDFIDELHRETTAPGATAGLAPRTNYDLSLLDEFSKRAAPADTPAGPVRRVIAAGFNAVTQLRTTIGLPPKAEEQDNRPPLKQRVLDRYLDDRGPR